MSKTSPVLNGENTSEVTEFPTDAAVNMVAANYDDISCTKPVTVDTFVSEDVKQAGMTYSCEFDHMYASLSEATSEQKESTEVKHLKELSLLHLDLIQQQSERIVTLEKENAALRHALETSNQRLERMERRVTLQKHREGSDGYAQSPVSCASPRAVSPPAAAAGPGASPSPAGGDAPPADRASPSADDAAPASQRAWPGDKKRKKDAEVSSVGSGSARRKRFSSWTSSMNSDGATADAKNCAPKETSYPAHARVSSHSTRMQRKARIKGGKKEEILTTDVPYYTTVGDPHFPWGMEDLDPDGRLCEVEVPSYRLRPTTSCYSMEGTENLDDEVFSKRHQRHELDERRRKRWDVQRIREQRQIEKLKQREQAASRRSSAGGRCREAEEPLVSLWPQPDDAKYLEVVERVPVGAFGQPVPSFLPSEFSLPWITSSRYKSNCSYATRRRNDQKR
ncbi:male-specific lethal 1 homolog isoform X2 [Bacillus rossius redtenbacheri]|uniref:male-specific lethal 1 homolog isoform X2 n=1 Tax=Bacillus rossius redtenbacheri TaxID=93214 RepID=UPI002FDE367B